MENNPIDKELEDLDELSALEKQSRFKKSLLPIVVILVIVIVVGLVAYFSFSFKRDKKEAKPAAHTTVMAPFPDYQPPPPPPPPPENKLDLGQAMGVTGKKEETWQDRRNMGSMDVFGGSGGSMPQTKESKETFDAQGFPVQPENESGELAASLKPTKVVMAQATILPDRNFLLTRGDGFDCDIPQALDSRSPGFIYCIVARDVYSDNGRVLLVPRGTQLDGEARGGGSVNAGQVRIGALFNRLKTPKGVIVDLNSPATDQLGVAGVMGHVENHFWERFGAALAISFFDTTWQIAASRLIPTDGGITNNFGGAGYGGGGKSVVDSVLQQQANIRPSIVSNQGGRIRVTLARDLDFSSVYRLKVKP